MTSSERCELVLELQKRLRYKFSNILLLHEALTHPSIPVDGSGYVFWTIGNSGVSYRKKTYNKLKLLGKSVLKFTAACLSLVNQSEGVNEGQLTKYSATTLDTAVLTKIGEVLSLEKYIQVAGDLRRNDDFSIESLFSPTIQAIFGALFIDFGGSTSDDCLRKVLQIYVRLWIFSNCPIIPVTFGKILSVGEELEALDKRFPPPPSPDIVEATLGKYNSRLELPELEDLERKLNYSFGRCHLLKQALTHDSVHQYNELRNNVPDYERLEFLGDAVFELVICEYLFWHFFNHSKDESSTSTFCKVALDKYTGQEFQKELASHLSLLSFVRKPTDVDIDSFGHDFLEAIIGAVYVDSHLKYGLRQVKNVLISLCQRNHTKLKHDSLVLPYTMKTFYGSKCRLQKYFQRDSSSMNCKRPAVVVVQVIIRDIHTFQTAWRYFCSSQEEHEERLNDAITFERKRGMDEVRDSQASCNEMEFNRVSLYRLAASQTPKFLKALDLSSSVLPESSTFRGESNNNNITSFESTQAPQQSWGRMGIQWARRLEMNYFWIWKGLGEVVGMLALAKIVCVLVSPSSYISALIYVIFLFHLFSDGQFVFGNMLW